MHACVVDNAQIPSQNLSLQVYACLFHQVSSIRWKGSSLNDSSFHWLWLPRNGHLLGISPLFYVQCVLLHAVFSDAWRYDLGHLQRPHSDRQHSCVDLSVQLHFHLDLCNCKHFHNYHWRGIYEAEVRQQRQLATLTCSKASWTGRWVLDKGCGQEGWWRHQCGFRRHHFWIQTSLLEVQGIGEAIQRSNRQSQSQVNHQQRRRSLGDAPTWLARGQKGWKRVLERSKRPRAACQGLWKDHSQRGELRFRGWSYPTKQAAQGQNPIPVKRLPRP